METFATIISVMIGAFGGGWLWGRATAPICSVREHWQRDAEEREKLREGKNEKLPPVKS